MTYRARPTGADRAKAIAGVVLVYAVMLAALLLVRTSAPLRTSGEVPPVLIDISEPPPPQPEPQPGKAKEEEGAAGKKAEPIEVVVPKPKRVIPAKSPITAAPMAGKGSGTTAGAVNSGTGPGAGGSGTGRGGGGSGGGGSPPQWLSGELRNRDYPREALRNGLTGQVSVRFTVRTNGRIANCRVVASSGSPLLDATTCRLLTRRLRFRPARNAAGIPIETDLGSDYTWGINFRRY
jgi:periplasmic protein TonB